ncbi:hypothetical protein D3C74_396240 [compost metagenome]
MAFRQFEGCAELYRSADVPQEHPVHFRRKYGCDPYCTWPCFLQYFPDECALPQGVLFLLPDDSIYPGDQLYDSELRQSEGAWAAEPVCGVLAAGGSEYVLLPAPEELF